MSQAPPLSGSWKTMNRAWRHNLSGFVDLRRPTCRFLGYARARFLDPLGVRGATAEDRVGPGKTSAALGRLSATKLAPQTCRQRSQWRVVVGPDYRCRSRWRPEASQCRPI